MSFFLYKKKSERYIRDSIKHFYLNINFISQHLILYLLIHFSSQANIFK